MVHTCRKTTMSESLGTVRNHKTTRCQIFTACLIHVAERLSLTSMQVKSAGISCIQGSSYTRLNRWDQ